jgi:NAD(P)H-dependent FMN reductase
MLNILVILGSIRQQRFGEQPARWVIEELKKYPDIKATLVDVRELGLPLFDEPVSPSMNKGNYLHPEAVEWAKKVGEADGFIIVTPEYNHGYPSGLKNAIDYVYHEWNNKPVAFVSYGGISGGTRAVQQLRQVVVELQMAPIRQGVHMPAYWSNLDEKGQMKPSLYQSQLDAMVPQLVWWANALKTARETTK